MSKNIDERVVEMRFDNSKFESNARTTMSTLDKLKQSLKFDDASKSFENINQAAGKVKMDGIGSACETVSAKFSALQVAAVTALANITNDAVNAGKRIVSALTIDGARDGFAEYEEKMGSVQTIMNGTGESLSTVMGYLEELNRYADQTIYSFSDMTSSIGKFTNAGVDLKTAVAAIQGISNATALSGGAADKASIAMYNFAQALSVGYVGLTDWKSIELSGVATLQFKQHVMDTAVELGTLRKEADGTYHTIEKGTEVTAEGMRETLKQQWFTSDVLTKALAAYSDTSTQLGRDATEAATKVKTFSMMVNTLKESIGSGWAVSWEKLIGDFNQASDLFTQATNSISDVISAQADARNKFIDDAFNKSGITDKKEWTDLSMSISSAGADVDQFKNTIIQTAEANGVSVKELVAQYGSFEKSLESGWLSSDILEQSVEKIQKLGQVSPEFSKLAAAVSVANKPFQTLREELTAVSGRTHIVNSLTNVFKALNSVLKPIKEAFRDIFPAKTGADLRDALGNFEKFTETLILSEEASERVKTTFTGFFKVLRSGVDTVKSIIQAFSPLGDIVKIVISNLLSAGEGLGNFFNTLDKGSDSTSLFKTVLNAIHDALQTFANNLQSYIDKAKTSIKSLKDMLTQSWNTGALSVVAKAVENIKNTLSGFTTGASEGIKNFLNTIGKGFDGSGFEKVSSVLTSFANGISKVAGIIGEILKPIIQKLKDFFSELDILDSLGMALEAGGISAVVAVLGRFVDNIGDFIEQIGVLTSPVETISGFVKQMGDIFGSLEEKIRVSVVKDFAISVGILAAAIFALSTIDAEGARRSVGIVSLLIGEVVGIFATMNKLSTLTSTSNNPLTAFFQNLGSAITGKIQAGTLLATASAIKKIAISVGILAISMKLIADIPIGQMLASFGVVSVLLWELVGVTATLSKVEGKLAKGAGSLMTMAASILILSGAMKIMASMELGELVQSGIALTILIGELVAVCKLLQGGEGIQGAGAMIALASAVLILSGAMKVMATMSFEEISKGLFAVAGVLVELGVALALMPAAIPGAAALLIASAALLVLAGALRVLAGIDSGAILPILGVLGGVLGELVVSLNLMILALPGAAALIVAAGAIAILVPALMALSKAKPEEVYSAIGELAVALLTIGGVSAVLGVASPLILAFAAALLVLGGAILTIGAGVALAGVGLTSLCTSLGLLAEISKESAERIVETLQIILNGIIELIPNMVEAFGEGIIGICEVINKGGPVIKETFNTIFGLLVQVLSENIPALTDAFSQMLVALMEQTATYIPQMVDLFMQLITGIIEAITANLPSMIQAGVDLMVAFINGVQSSHNQLIDAAINAIIAFINGLADSIRTHTPELIEAVRNLFNAVIDAMLLILSNGNPLFVQKARALMASFKAGLSEKIGEIRNVITKTVNDMITAATEKVGAFKEAAGQLVNGFIGGIKEKVGEAATAVRKMAGNAVSALRNALDVHSPSRIANEIGQYFGEGFANGITEKSNAAADSTAELGRGAADTMESSIEALITRIQARSAEFQKAGSEMMRFFTLGVQESVPNMEVPVNGYITRFLSIFTNSQYKAQEAMKMILDSMIRVVVNMYTTFTSEGTTLVNKFIEGIRFRSYYINKIWIGTINSSLTSIRNNRNNFYNAASYLVDGFIIGIQDGIPAVKEAAARMAKEAYEATMAALESHSPSRLFMEVGGYVGQGFVIGIDNYDGKAASSGTKLAKSAIDAANEIVKDGFNIEPVITPVLDLSNVTEGTKQINSMLSKTQALNISASMNQNRVSNGASVRNEQQPQSTTFIQNNYSPKALSRIDIYRQTQNQLLAVRG